MSKIKYMLILLTIYNLDGYSQENNLTRNVWINQLDPVYQLDLNKYQKFSTQMILKNGKKIDFVSVKSMMSFYFHPEKYPEYGVKSRNEIDKMFVKDYLTGRKIDAKNAWYVFGSRLVGPHGDDLIPLSSQTSLQLFRQKYGGTKVLRMDEFSSGLIKYLDM